MSLINVSELIADPDFCQPNGISITRYENKVVDHMVQEVPEDIVVEGIITIRIDNEDDMLPEADSNKEAINVFTHKRLMTVGIDKASGQSYGSDIVHFDGADYIVRACKNNAQYGYCMSVAVKIEQDVM